MNGIGVNPDVDALSELIPRYQNALYGYLKRLVHDPVEAEDLFQQTWMKVVENLHRYDAGRSFETWLFSIAHNLAVDFLRRQRPWSLDEPTPDGSPARSLLPAVQPEAFDALLFSERQIQLEQAMRYLPATYQEVISLRFHDERKLEEIAEITGAQLSTVKSRLRRGLENLRARLESS